MKTIRQTATIRGATPHGSDRLETPREAHRRTGEDRTQGRCGVARVRQGAVGDAAHLDQGSANHADVALARLAEGSPLARDVSLARARGGTRITFRQSGVPATQFRSVKQGWIDFYWKPLKKTFGG